MLKNYSKIEVHKNGDKYYVNDKGQPHRLDGPAAEASDGTKYWFINGNGHRNIDPFAEYSDGEKRRYFKDKRHRIGGSFYSTQKLWYIHGEQYFKQDYFNKVWDI